MSEFTAQEEREFEQEYYAGCRHWQEEAYLREWQKATGQTLREILRERTAMREAEEAREWADIQAEWAEAEADEPSEEDYKSGWESLKVAEDAKGYEGDELVEWEALKLENDIRFYPERFPERAGQILALVLPHLRASMTPLARLQEEIAECLEGEEKAHFLAVPAETWGADGIAQRIVEDCLQTEELKKAILHSTQGMSSAIVQKALLTDEDWVLSLRLKVDEEIRFTIVDMLC